jgi:hypothetical protein
MSYKEDMEELIQIIEQMIELLTIAEEYPYAELFKNYSEDCKCVENEEEADQIRRIILRIFQGGMGSFNDLALYKDGKLWSRHKDFSILKTKLFNTLVDQL